MKTHPLRCVLLSSALLLFPFMQAQADTADKTIALSNNYAGNSWRQNMLSSWKQTTDAAVKKGIISSADSFTTGENQATEQAAQIQNLILQGYNAIVVDAASPTALNGAIKQACDAGIIVVSFDGVVTEPCAYRISMDFKQSGVDQMDYLAKRFPGGANVLEVRGLAGVSVDEQIHSGIIAGAQKHPNLKIVGSVNGNWSQTAAQKAVASILPSLPKIDALVTQGDDGYGAAQAFAAAGRPTPTIVFGNREEELSWWKKQKDANGYQSFSISSAPSISSLAFWVAQQLLDGKKMPHDLLSPAVSVTQDTLEASLKGLEKGGILSQAYSVDDVATLKSPSAQ
ncbi:MULTISPECIES: substrate-binding domain-containing protein [unclassified Pseudomonas]|uniref:substrate-binding domain-containing protein n=1 Tax=unclassified Pseudomonas TaxID=196821 RepID=UPI002AC94554|nr:MULTISPECIES: substrate-binding domain-containing protein [unclassified Pseudomonas]MEB0041038.1 substrate-binding domain-containing protein [Pseudomonas sp. MH10]MEB0076631.1 substrate-binding domain-containing protein [Pseudomonas sp. MH10out]MEB0090438.1 substrate-binding domain-containing protein [Pseudomonas sp. CCI4.2]MEB0100719.1 substrate-binding domain-containing protein [Pseudomonas sp. CCI3.2]MEB0120842.1 substrate-binding domain-containing protein [Pseudomonas sp. CCI1.2]